MFFKTGLHFKVKCRITEIMVSRTIYTVVFRGQIINRVKCVQLFSQHNAVKYISLHY